MNYYTRRSETQNGTSTQVWKIDECSAVRVGVANPEGGPSTYFRANPGETIWGALRRMTPWFEGGENPFHETVLKPGEYYPRMARPIDQYPDEAPGWSPGTQREADTIAIGHGQLTALTRQLDRICQTIHPTRDTFATYGHDIRNLLILACTEVESHWRGVLVSNGAARDHFSTKAYVKLSAAMRLNSYAVSFPSYPWLEPVSPFLGWGTSDKPSQGLAWYDAYNAAKHNRENEFARSTLENAFAAVTACAIMMAAQFGRPVALGQSSDLRAFFNFSSMPIWPLSDIYIFPYGEGTTDWTEVKYPFDAS